MSLCTPPAPGGRSQSHKEALHAAVDVEFEVLGNQSQLLFSLSVSVPESSSQRVRIVPEGEFTSRIHNPQSRTPAGVNQECRVVAPSFYIGSPPSTLASTHQ
jgi:hypothetical protein